MRPCISDQRPYSRTGPSMIQELRFASDGCDLPPVFGTSPPPPAPLVLSVGTPQFRGREKMIPGPLHYSDSTGTVEFRNDDLPKLPSGSWNRDGWFIRNGFHV